MEDKKLFTTLIQKEMNEDMTLIAYANKSNVIDRSGDIIADEAWDLSNFLLNPVICAFHQYDRPPVAKALWVKVVKGQGLRMKIKFSNSDEGKEFYKLFADGILNAFSIGFRGLERKYKQDFTDEDLKKYKIDGKLPYCIYTKVELFEVSVVAVPDNQASLTERNEDGSLATKSVKEFVAESIKEFNLSSIETGKSVDDINLDSINIEEKEVGIETLENIVTSDMKDFFNGDNTFKYKTYDDIPEDLKLLIKEHETEANGDLKSITLHDKADAIEKLAEIIDEQSSDDTEQKEADITLEELSGLTLESKEAPEKTEQEPSIKDLIEQINLLKLQIAQITEKSEETTLEVLEIPEDNTQDIKSMFSDLKEYIDSKLTMKKIPEETSTDINIKDITIPAPPTEEAIEIDKEQLVALVKQAVLDVTKGSQIDLSQIGVEAFKKAKGEIF